MSSADWSGKKSTKYERYGLTTDGPVYGQTDVQIFFVDLLRNRSFLFFSSFIEKYILHCLFLVLLRNIIHKNYFVISLDSIFDVFIEI